MAKISQATASEHLDLDGIEGHYGPLGDYTVGFETYDRDEDPAPLFKGLPNDACQSPHWGVVLEGTLVYRYTDGSEEVIEAGEAYYAPPGHLPVFKTGTRLVEFSPTDELDKTMAVVMANMEAMQAG
ncbi:MAG TPA: cupin domain-containing protein [Acidimicrobiia bacterium]|nr:cupin domain-containing protein [Acidimicrobiia bacterium]